MNTRGQAPGSDALRVLIVAPTPFFGDRGCHVRIYEEAKALSARGIATSVVTYAAGRDLPNLRIVRARAVPGVEAQPLGFTAGRPFLDLAVWLAARREVVRFRPHLIHAHLHEGVAIGVMLSRRYRLPLVADLQGSLTEELVDHGVLGEGGYLASVSRRVERWLVCQPSHIMMSSTHSAGLVASHRADPATVVALPDGVDVTAFRPEPPDGKLIDALGLAGKRVVVFLGVLTDYQGVDLLMDVAGHVKQSQPDVHFLVMGYPNEDRYRAAAKQRGLDSVMSFPGRVPYDQAARWLCVGEVAISAKRSLTEANGKLLNYMSCGLPVVASDTPVNRELLGDAGCFAPVDDAPAFARHVDALLADRVRAGRIGASLRARAETVFAWPVLAKRLEAVYRAALAAQGGNPGA